MYKQSIIAALIALAHTGGGVDQGAPGNQGSWFMNPAAQVSGAYGEVACSNVTPTLIGGLSKRQSILITNNGPNTIHIGTNSAVTITTGTPIKTGVAIAIDASNAITLYCIAETAAQTGGAAPSVATNYLEIK